MKREESPWFVAGFTREWWLALTLAQREEVLDGMSDAEVEGLFTDWRVWARDKQLAPDGDWRTWLLCCGRGFGKLLCIETPIPTPEGWRRLGDLAVGDEVFDEAGRPCRIRRVFDDIPQVAYRLHFSDSTSIDACSEHQWVTITHRDRKQLLRHQPGTNSFPDNWPAWRDDSLGVGVGAAIRTTQEIVETFTHSARGDTNHCIPVCGDLRYPERDLPIDPWLFGYWLGNGSTGGGGLACHHDDVTEVRARARAQGYEPLKIYANGRDFTAAGLSGDLRAMGVIHNKSVPREYMQASPAQRHALLSGLLDSDGYCCPENSQVEFCSTARTLADSVMELARSLGQKPVLGEGRAMLNGVDYGPKYRVTWRPTRNPFSLPRKAAAYRDPVVQALRNRHRMIVRWENIKSTPMRCLTVDGANSMFLAGEGMIPTHNTRTAVEYIIDEVEKGYVKRIAIVGQGLDDIRTVMVEGDSGFIACSKPGNRPVFRPSVGGGRLIWPDRKDPKTGKRIKGAVAFIYSAEDTEGLRGPQFHLGWFDEPMACPPEKRERAISNLRMGLRLPVPGSRPRLILSTTPKKSTWMKQMLADEANPKKHLVVTRGSTYENEDNLAEDFIEMVIEDYEGTRLGKQEIHGELLADDEGAIWTDEVLKKQRILCPDTEDHGGFWPTQLLQAFAKTCDEVVVGVDPNTKAGTKSAHAAGIVVVARKGKKRFVLADYSTKGGPAQWGRRAVQAAHDFGANHIVAEVNMGGDMVKMVIQQAADDMGIDVRVIMVRATRGKQRRAEPVAAAYERGIVFHMGIAGSPREPGAFYKLEEQMLALHDANDPTGEDFDRADALVWGLTRLKLGRSSGGATTHVGFQTFSAYGG